MLFPYWNRKLLLRELDEKVESKYGGLSCLPNAMKDGSLYGWLLH
jgi:hypothetical protein